MKKQTQEDIGELNKQIEEWKGKYLRALADYQNLEKHTVEDRKKAREHAADQVIGEMLVILDSLKKAQIHLKDEGLGHILESFAGVLRNHHVQKIEALHKQFNPQEMECVEVVESDKDGEVVEEVRTGYMSGNKILRVAQVKVGKARNDTELKTEQHGT